MKAERNISKAFRLHSRVREGNVFYAEFFKFWNGSLSPLNLGLILEKGSIELYIQAMLWKFQQALAQIADMPVDLPDGIDGGREASQRYGLPHKEFE